MVDVVVVDSHIEFDHPEFDSRGKKVNWFKYSERLGYDTLNLEYQYENIRPFKGRDGSHGTSMAGLIGGNTLGIAKKSNIFNIHYNYDYDPYFEWSRRYFDYIIEFAKERNNPVICNLSIAFKKPKLWLKYFTSCKYRGEVINLENLNDSEKKEALKGIIPEEHFLGDVYITRLPVRHKIIDDGMKKMIDNGIIVVGASRNSSLKVDVPGGIDYDNYLTNSELGNIYFNRGSSPGCAPGVICVSSLHCGGNGPRIDYFEDGDYTLAPVKYQCVSRTMKDFRSDNHEVSYQEGTSVATAKITGKLALILEENPNLTQEDARTILNTNKN